MLYIYLTYSDDLISSLFYAFSDEVGFVAKNKTNGDRFPFSDETSFVTNSMTNSTF